MSNAQDGGSLTTEYLNKIKFTRSFTSLLGKFGIKELQRPHTHCDAHGNKTIKTFYGLGLKEAKDYVDQYELRIKRSTATTG